MENNYFIKTNSMVEKKSYLSQPNISPVQDIYTMGIESEVDIFSDIPLSLFSETAGRQISSVMTKFKREYIRYICQKESAFVMPKLRYYEDESSFGMVWNDDLKKNFESRSGNIVLNNIDEIIHEVLDFIFRVY